MGTWIPLPLADTLSGCQDNAQLADAAAWPKPSWTLCGTGCQVASVVDVTDQLVGDTEQTAADSSGPELYYRTQTHGSTYRFNVLRRASDDQAVVVTRISNPCNSAHTKQSAPFLFEINSSGGAPRWVAHYSVAAQALHLPTALVMVNAPANGWFSWDSGWGALVANNVLIDLDSDPTNLSSVFTDGHSLTSARARNGVVLWVDWATFPGKVLSYTASGGEKTLFTAPNDVAGLATSDSTIAFFNVTGPDTQIGTYNTASVEWLPFTSDPAAVSITAGPDITGHVGGGINDSATAGDFIAFGFFASGSSAPGIAIVQMSTGNKWFIAPSAGTWLHVAGMSSTTLMAFEGDLGMPTDGSIFLRWKRWDLSHLADFATPIP